MGRFESLYLTRILFLHLYHLKFVWNTVTTPAPRSPVYTWSHHFHTGGPVLDRTVLPTPSVRVKRETFHALSRYETENISHLSK